MALQMAGGAWYETGVRPAGLLSSTRTSVAVKEGIFSLAGVEGSDLGRCIAGPSPPAEYRVESLLLINKRSLKVAKLGRHRS